MHSLHTQHRPVAAATAASLGMPDLQDISTETKINPKTMNKPSLAFILALQCCSCTFPGKCVTISDLGQKLRACYCVHNIK